MHAEARAFLDEIVLKMRAGRMRRRTFLERACALGLSLPVASSLLEACGSGNAQILVWQSQHDDHGIYAQIVAKFNADQRNNGLFVVHQNGPFSSTALHDTLVRKLGDPQDASIDVLSLDVIWLDEFATRGWLVPVYSVQEVTAAISQKRYFSGVLESCMYQGRLYTAPLRADVGLLYYWTNLVPKAPGTWAELVEQARQVQGGRVRNGFVWEASGEGLVCMFVEVLAGYNAAILSADGRRVTVDSPEAVAALREMVNWVGTISPDQQEIGSYAESDARVAWQNGYAAFMRNWYDAKSLVQDQVAPSEQGAFVCVPPPHAGPGTRSHACIGGWQLGVNKRSRKQDAAWHFVQAVLQSTEQDFFVSTDIQTPDPQIPDLKEIYNTAVSRPRSPKYVSQISQHISDQVLKALSGRSSPEAALRDLKSILTPIVSTP